MEIKVKLKNIMKHGIKYLTQSENNDLGEDQDKYIKFIFASVSR